MPPFDSETGKEASKKAHSMSWAERRREALDLIGWDQDPYTEADD